MSSWVPSRFIIQGDRPEGSRIRPIPFNALIRGDRILSSWQAAVDLANARALGAGRQQVFMKRRGVAAGQWVVQEIR